MSSERLALSRDQYGATPLHKAVLFYQPKLVKLISEKFPLTTKVGIPITISHTTTATCQAKDQEGRTPLHYAAALHDSGIFYRYLLKCGADELIQDKVCIDSCFSNYSLNLLVVWKDCQALCVCPWRHGPQLSCTKVPGDA